MNGFLWSRPPYVTNFQQWSSLLNIRSFVDWSGLLRPMFQRLIPKKGCESRSGGKIEDVRLVRQDVPNIDIRLGKFDPGRD